MSFAGFKDFTDCEAKMKARGIVKNAGRGYVGQ